MTTASYAQVLDSPYPLIYWDEKEQYHYIITDSEYLKVNLETLDRLVENGLLLSVERIGFPWEAKFKVKKHIRNVQLH